MPLGDGPADGPHVRGPPGRVEGRGSAFIGAQCRTLFFRRLRVVPDGDVGVLVGQPGAERDQVVLRGRLGLVELPLPALAGGAHEQEEAKHGQHEKNTDDDRDVAQRV